VQAAAANVGQRRNQQLLVGQQFADPQRSGIPLVKLMPNHRQIVVQWLHVRFELGPDVTRQESQVAVTPS
jgi:hypothetical protein